MTVALSIVAIVASVIGLGFCGAFVVAEVRARRAADREEPAL